jgi:Inhibitor of apoptosis-promoting Bax1
VAVLERPRAAHRARNARYELALGARRVRAGELDVPQPGSVGALEDDAIRRPRCVRRGGSHHLRAAARDGANGGPRRYPECSLGHPDGFRGADGRRVHTRKDFSFLGSLLRWGGILALVAIVAGAIFGFQLGTFFSVAMVGLAGASILYDTSNVLHHYSEDSHVAAALELFASVALMFWYVLQLFMSSSRND